MGVVNFPRDAQGRIILESELPAAAPEPEAEPTPRPVRATEPGRRTPMASLLPRPQSDQEPATPARPPARSWPTIAAVVCGLALALMLVLLLQQAPAAPRAQPTIQPTFAPTLAPSALPAFGAPLDVALVAYFDPADPATATALEDGRRVLPVARHGREWLQLQLEDGARVWVRWRDLPAPSASLDQLPDLAPPPPATAAPIVVAQPRQPAVCDEHSAPFRITRQVMNGSIPIGELAVWSCVSAEDAEAQAAQREAELRATYVVTTEAKTTEARP
jgi:hypothetical protein